VSADLSQFAQFVAGENFNLAEAALLVASDPYPDLDSRRYLATLDEYAETIRARLPADAFPEQKILAMNYYLFRELGYNGNIDNYYDRRNSYLNEVIDRRTGIPLTLSILYMEVGRRLGLNILGISFPGHFLVKLKVKRGQLVIDPFLAGETQSEEDLRRRLAQVLPTAQADKTLIHRYLGTASPRQIIARLLRNLKNLYMQAEEYNAALQVIQRMLLLLPEAVEELRDRGILYQQLECFRPALSDLRNYARRRPDAPDIEAIHERILALQRACASLH
jgi:regulator of sirC expression with transglutaminase-like and TPR domain